MKCALRQEDPGRAVSPGCRMRVVGPSARREEKGMIKTDWARSLRLRVSRETMRTQWRSWPEGSRKAVHISPRLGARRTGDLLAIEVDLGGGFGQGALEGALMLQGFAR